MCCRLLKKKESSVIGLGEKDIFRILIMNLAFKDVFPWVESNNLQCCQEIVFAHKASAFSSRNNH